MCEAALAYRTEFLTVQDELKAIEPFPAVFDARYVSRLDATHTKDYGSMREAAEQVRERAGRITN